MRATATATRQRKGVAASPRDAPGQDESDTKQDRGPSIIVHDASGQDEFDKKKMPPRAASRSRRRAFAAGGALLLLALIFTQGADASRWSLPGFPPGCTWECYLATIGSAVGAGKKVGGGEKKQADTTKGPGGEAQSGPADGRGGGSQSGPAEGLRGGAQSGPADPKDVRWADLPVDFSWGRIGCHWLCYRENYPDLKKNKLPNTEWATRNHYVTFGIKEGRDCKCKDFPPGCSWECYLANQPDLKLPERTKEAALEHYVKTGLGEGRDCECDDGQEAGAKG